MVYNNMNYGRDRGFISVISDAKSLIALLKKLSVKIETNGIRVSVVKIWPLTLDIRIKEND